VPNYHKRAFREAVVNSLVHRDYTRLGAVHVRLENDGLTISNPGGFVEGVNLGNLLVSEPRPRNPLLADIVKRIGLAERTGRGIDLIYERFTAFWTAGARLLPVRCGISHLKDE
jgi:ATP-dependent DNA helicase RecG